MTVTSIDIYDPDRYVAGVPHDVFDTLRAKSPVYYQEMPGEPGYWAVLNHADVVYVAKHPNLFSASEGGVVLENLDAPNLAMMRDMLLAMDPPRHLDYRRPLLPSFKARVIGGLEGRIRTICREIFDRVPEDGNVEFVHDVTSSLPSQVIGELMGLPRDDWSKIHRWAEIQTSGQDPELANDDQDDPDQQEGGYANSAQSSSMRMALYAMELAAARRVAPPQEDLTTLILESDFGGHHMTDADFGSFFVQLVTAGNDTTKTMLASGLRALLDHPEQMAELRADNKLIPHAVEEILRWANPLHYFRRTATEDTELGGASIKAGDKVAMYYTAANRDPAVFENPHAFDIHRSPNPHLSFGIAEHFCLGVHLARLEGRVFFEELLATFPVIERTGEVKRTRSNLNNALKALPVRLVRG